MSDLKSESEKKPDLQPGAREPFRLIIPKKYIFLFFPNIHSIQRESDFLALG